MEKSFGVKVVFSFEYLYIPPCALRALLPFLPQSLELTIPFSPSSKSFLTIHTCKSLLARSHCFVAIAIGSISLVLAQKNMNVFQCTRMRTLSHMCSSVHACVLGWVCRP